MAVFTKQFGVSSPRDLFYPNVLTPNMKLDPGGTQDAIRRAFDAIYQIAPPPNSRTPSTVPATFGFIDQVNINLNTNTVVLQNEKWQSTAAGGVSWNAFTLAYHGKIYNVFAGGPVSLRYIWWSLNSPNALQSSNTFPDLSFVGPDGSTAAMLIGVWDSSSGKLIPLWASSIAENYLPGGLIQVDNGSSATQTAMLLLWNGSVQRVKVNSIGGFNALTF